MQQDFLWISADDLLEIEIRQLCDEGKELPESLETELRVTAARGDEWLRTSEGQAAAGQLLDKTAALKQQADYAFDEPIRLEEIRAARPQTDSLPRYEGDYARLRERIYGAWLGRVYGCYLGKPVEGLRRQPGEKLLLETFLKATEQWPLQGYFSLDYPDEVLAKHNLNRSWRAGPPQMPEDDDTNYTIIAYCLMREKGTDFAPRDIAAFWLENLPIGRTYTAERVAYRNFCLNIAPPESASYRNPYREWIGAQIRGDFFGYASPGDPVRAAELAWRDATISHIKNGVYGEMWVAAMLAAAYVLEDRADVIRAGLGQIPSQSRLARAIEEVFEWHESGLSYEAAIGAIHERWNEKRFYDWCHTIPNAQICIVALLWGEGDYIKTTSQAVLGGFDTDCNCATVGSLMGLMLGARGLPRELMERLNDRLQSGVRGFFECSISETATEMANLVDRLVLQQ